MRVFLACHKDWGSSMLEWTGMCVQGCACSAAWRGHEAQDGRRRCRDRRDAYQGYPKEVGKWAHLPGGAAMLAAADLLESGVQSKAHVEGVRSDGELDGQ